MQYTTVLHAVRKQFGISCNEYCIADMVYHLSANPSAPVAGWCSQSRGNMADEMGLSRQSVINILQKLEKLKLVERHPELEYVRTTQLWYDTIRGCKDSLQGVKKMDSEGSQESVQGVKKVDTPCKESLQDGCKESLHNNKSIDNKIDNNTTPPQTRETVAESSEVDLGIISERKAIVLPFREAQILIEKHRAEILNAPITRDRECMKYKITADYYNLLTNAFFDQQLSDAERKIPIEFYRIKKHFDNWMRVQVNLGTQSNFHPQFKPQPVSGGNSYNRFNNGHPVTVTATFKSAIPD